MGTLRLEVLEEPGLEEACEAVRRGVAQHMMVLVAGRCRAWYRGRGTSTLGEGDRLLLIKPDGSVLLHRPSGYSPVNWQPSTSFIEVAVRSGELLVRAVRSRPREILDVYFASVGLVALIGGMVDEAEFVEYLDEHLIRDLLAEEPWLIEEGLRIAEKEKPVRSGYVDLYGVDSQGKPVVIELKRVKAGRKAVLQLKRYVDYFAGELGVRPRGILVSPGISSDAARLLRALGLEHRRINLRGLYRRALEKRRDRGLHNYGLRAEERGNVR